jgi:hypothetical protein
MRCIDITSEGVLTATADVVCGPAQYVMLTQAELDQYTASPFHLSAGEGGLVAVGIVGVWAAAFAFRSAIRALNSGNPET